MTSAGLEPRSSRPSARRSWGRSRAPTPRADGGRAPAGAAAAGARRTGASSSCSPSSPSPRSSPAGTSSDQAESTRSSSARCRVRDTQPLFDEARPARHRLLPRLCRAASTRRSRAPLQHVDAGRPRRRDRRQVPQDPPARPRRARAVAPLPAPREALLRGRRPRLPGVRAAFGGVVRHACICNDRRWPETYRVHGPAGRRADPARLQHAGAQPARARARRARATSTTTS